MSIESASFQVILPATLATILAAYATYYFYSRHNKKTVNIPEDWKPVGKVTKLYLYPLKSGHCVELKDAECTNYGLMTTATNEFQLRDRSFVVYSENTFEFKTARVLPKMVLIEVSVHDKEHILFDAPNQRPLYVKVPDPQSAIKIQVKLHKGEPIDGIDCGDEAAAWFSRVLLDKGCGLRLAHHDAQFKRDIEHVHQKVLPAFPKLTNESAGMFSDLVGYLLMNQSSIDNLNKNLENPITDINFRPNMLVDSLEENGIAPFSEENWEWVKIGDAVFRNVKPCTRCILTTVDPNTGIMSKDREPLRSLRRLNILKEPLQIQLAGESPVIGINMGLRSGGLITVGDIVYIS